MGSEYISEQPSPYKIKEKRPQVQTADLSYSNGHNAFGRSERRLLRIGKSSKEEGRSMLRAPPRQD
jgi:hypothetical protein